MNNVIQYSILAFCLSIGSSLAEPTDAEKLSALAACSKESSALNRLDCYDSVMRPLAVVINTDAQIKRSQSWLSAYAQEKDRHENDTDFLVTNSGGDNPKVLLTSPALGRQPPRPVLVFSCIDNITRMQIMLAAPMTNDGSAITLRTGKETIKTNWFSRDNGYVFEASRGLPGIQEIQRLIHGDTLTIESSDPSLNGLVFNLSTLPQAIAPLRSACRW